MNQALKVSDLVNQRLKIRNLTSILSDKLSDPSLTSSQRDRIDGKCTQLDNIDDKYTQAIARGIIETDLRNPGLKIIEATIRLENKIRDLQNIDTTLNLVSTAITLFNEIIEPQTLTDTSAEIENIFNTLNQLLINSSSRPSSSSSSSSPTDEERDNDGKNIVNLALSRVGQEYVYGAKVDYTDPNHNGPWDCAELVTWAVYQATRILYGAYNNSIPTAAGSAYTGFWKEQALRDKRTISVEDAAYIPGAALVRHRGRKGHIAISAGSKRTVEAHSRNKGVIRYDVFGRDWDFGVLVPGVNYRFESPVSTSNSTSFIFKLTSPLTCDERIAEIQELLKQKGFFTGFVSGIYDDITELAVINFQVSAGLLVDGEVGTDTYRALRIHR